MRRSPMLLLRALLCSCAALAALPAAAASAKAPAFDGFAADKPQDVRPQDVVTWEAFQATETADEKVSVTLRMTLKQDWHVYASNLKFGGPPGFTAEVAPPPATRFMDPIANHEVDVYAGGEFNLTYSGAPRWRGPTFPVTVTYVGCTNVICLFPYTQTLDVAFTPAPAPAPAAPVASAGLTSGTIGAADTAGAGAAAGDDDLETRLARLFAAGGLSFGALLAVVFLGGMLSNLTPCVAPMVPITLRLLARQGASPYASAAFYGLGIVVTYSLLGLVAGMSKGLFGSLLASTPFNLAFAAIMVALGVTMLGYGDLSKLQMLGNRLGGGKPSLANTFLMGSGAGLVAAPCTGPVLLALLAYVAKSNAGTATSVLLVGAYSVGFALPYVALGGSAAKASNLRVAPGLQVGVKLAFASVMFGLGFYYLRVPFYGVMQGLSGRWPELTGGALALGLALAAAWLVWPALNARKAAALAPAAALGFGLFGAWQWATSTTTEGGAEAAVYHTEASATAAALAARKPILIDMWAEWCEACKKMDATTFADPRVRAQLAKDWVILRFDFTQSTPENDQLQAKYEVQGLPTLIMLPPTGELAGKQAIYGYVGAAALINSLRQFTNQRAE